VTAVGFAARRRAGRWAAIAVAVVAFLLVSALLARWLGTENTERNAVVALLRDQARGDADAMLRRLRCRDDACVAQARENARTLRTRGDVTVVRVDSSTSHSVGGATGPTRVVWIAPGRLTTVQCVLVRRSGTPLSGMSVTLLGLSAPIDRQAACS
jgi:hypothetical protein